LSIELELKSPPISDSEFFFIVPHLKKNVQKGRGTDNQEKEEGTFRIPMLKSTPLPQRREQPKSPEAKTFDVQALRRTPRVKQEYENIKMEKPPTLLLFLDYQFLFPSEHFFLSEAQ
jgi:hypothetical protein